MSIPVHCDSCKQNFTARLELAGRTGKCPKCGTPLTVPVAAEPESAPEQQPTAAEKDEPKDKATKSQKEYAKRLGIEFDDDIGKWEMSDLITSAIEREEQDIESDDADEPDSVDVQGFLERLEDEGLSAIIIRWEQDSDGECIMGYTDDMDEDEAERMFIKIAMGMIVKLRSAPGYDQFIKEFIRTIQ